MLAQCRRFRRRGPETTRASMSQTATLATTAKLTALRDSLRRLEGMGDERAPVIPLGVAEIDACLPGGGLPPDRLQAVLGADVGAGTGFVAWLLGRIAEATGRPVAWIVRGRDLYAPGLAAYGLTPDRLIAVRAPRQMDGLWAVEECLRSRRLSAALLEADKVDMTAGRRLQLAAEAGGTACFLLFSGARSDAAHDAAQRAPTAALRWRAASAPTPAGDDSATVCWDVGLERARGGRPGAWRLTGDGARLRQAPAGRPAIPNPADCISPEFATARQSCAGA